MGEDRVKVVNQENPPVPGRLYYVSSGSLRHLHTTFPCGPHPTVSEGVTGGNVLRTTNPLTSPPGPPSQIHWRNVRSHAPHARAGPQSGPHPNMPAQVWEAPQHQG